MVVWDPLNRRDDPLVDLACSFANRGQMFLEQAVHAGRNKEKHLSSSCLVQKAFEFFLRPWCLLLTPNVLYFSACDVLAQSRWAARQEGLGEESSFPAESGANLLMHGVANRDTGYSGNRELESFAAISSAPGPSPRAAMGRRLGAEMHKRNCTSPSRRVEGVSQNQPAAP